MIMPLPRDLNPIGKKIRRVDSRFLLDEMLPHDRSHIDKEITFPKFDFPQEQLQRITKALSNLEILSQQYAHKEDTRKDRFYPYLLLRAKTGDRGARPLVPAVDPNSPDIWIDDREFANSVGIPETQGKSEVVVGDSLTIHAHVWNLGRAPIASGKVVFYWSNKIPTCEKDLNLIGAVYFNLSARTSSNCHALIRCSNPWVPSQAGTVYLVTCAFCFGDMPNKTWSYLDDRHMACRKVTVKAFVPVLDQVCEPLIVDEWTSVPITPYSHATQTFTPMLPNLVAVEVLLVSKYPTFEGDTITMTIRNAAGTNLFSKSIDVPESSEFHPFTLKPVWFDVSPPLPVVVGQQLSIELTDTGKNSDLRWLFSHENIYNGGQAISGAPSKRCDFGFRTYGIK